MNRRSCSATPKRFLLCPVGSLPKRWQVAIARTTGNGPSIFRHQKQGHIPIDGFITSIVMIRSENDNSPGAVMTPAKIRVRIGSNEKLATVVHTLNAAFFSSIILNNSTTGCHLDHQIAVTSSQLHPSFDRNYSRIFATDYSVRVYDFLDACRLYPKSAELFYDNRRAVFLSSGDRHSQNQQEAHNDYPMRYIHTHRRPPNWGSKYCRNRLLPDARCRRKSMRQSRASP